MRKSRLSVIAVISCFIVFHACYPGETVIDNGGKVDEQDDNVFSTIYVPGESGYAYFRTPAIVKGANGEILAFAQGRVDTIEDECDGDIVLKRSVDGGRTWGELIVVMNDGENRCNAPVPVVLESGKVLLLYSWNLGPVDDDHKIFCISSDDNGLTWHDNRDITPDILIEGEYRHVLGPCHGIVKTYDPHKGRIIVPARCASPYSQNSHVIYSDDDGLTWHKGGSTDFPQGNECTVVELGNGDLVLNMRNVSKQSFYRHDCTSKDGGVTFGPHRQTSLVEPITGCQGSLLRYSVDNETKNTIVLFSNPTHTSSRRFGAIKVSYDSCNSWTRMYQFVPSSGPMMYTGYSDLVLLDNGDIGVAYEGQVTLGIFFQTIKFSEIKDDYVYYD